MPRYKKYLIKAEDHFNESDYPWLRDDLDALQLKIENFSPGIKNKIVATIAKGKPVSNDDFEKNHSIADLLNSKKLEDLFDSSSHNQLFQQELEYYIGEVLK